MSELLEIVFVVAATVMFITTVGAFVLTKHSKDQLEPWRLGYGVPQAKPSTWTSSGDVAKSDSQPVESPAAWALVSQPQKAKKLVVRRDKAQYVKDVKRLYAQYSSIEPIARELGSSWRRVKRTLDAEGIGNLGRDPRAIPLDKQVSIQEALMVEGATEASVAREFEVGLSTVARIKKRVL